MGVAFVMAPERSREDRHLLLANVEFNDQR